MAILLSQRCAVTLEGAATDTKPAFASYDIEAVYAAFTPIAPV